MSATLDAIAEFLTRPAAWCATWPVVTVVVAALTWCESAGASPTAWDAQGLWSSLELTAAVGVSVVAALPLAWGLLRLAPRQAGWLTTSALVSMVTLSGLVLSLAATRTPAPTQREWNARHAPPASVPDEPNSPSELPAPPGARAAYAVRLAPGALRVGGSSVTVIEDRGDLWVLSVTRDFVQQTRVHSNEVALYDYGTSWVLSGRDTHGLARRDLLRTDPRHRNLLGDVGAPPALASLLLGAPFLGVMCVVCSSVLRHRRQRLAPMIETRLVRDGDRVTGLLTSSGLELTPAGDVALAVDSQFVFISGAIMHDDYRVDGRPTAHGLEASSADLASRLRAIDANVVRLEAAGVLIILALVTPTIVASCCGLVVSLSLAAY